MYFAPSQHHMAIGKHEIREVAGFHPSSCSSALHSFWGRSNVRTWLRPKAKHACNLVWKPDKQRKTSYQLPLLFPAASVGLKHGTGRCTQRTLSHVLCLHVQDLIPKQFGPKGIWRSLSPTRISPTFKIFKGRPSVWATISWDLTAGDEKLWSFVMARFFAYQRKVILATSCHEERPCVIWVILRQGCWS